MGQVDTDKITQLATHPQNADDASLLYRTKQKGFYNVPTSPATNSIMQVLGVNGDIKKLRTQAEATRAKGQLRLRQVDNKCLVEYQKDENNFITIELTDIEKIMGSRKGVKKVFLYSLVAINEQAYSVDDKTGLGVLRNNEITFSLKELVKAGLYKYNRTARVGFLSAVDTLTSLKVKGKLTTTKGGKKTNTIEGLAVIFTAGFIKNGWCCLKLNTDIDWGFICRFYTVLPRWAFALDSVNAFDLVYYIFYLARQNVKDIKERGYFTISLKAIHARLGLPPVEGNKHARQIIREPIERAIEEIEELNQNNKGFTITPMYDETWNTKDYIGKGYLKIGLAGDFAQAFIERAEDKEQLIESQQKQKQKVQNMAKAKVLAEKIKEQDE